MHKEHTTSNPKKDSSTNGDAGTQTRLRGPQRVLVRAAWFALVLLVGTVFIVAIPARLNTEDTTFTPKIEAALSEQGFSFPNYAVYQASFDIVIELAFITIAIVIFWRRSGDWLAIFVSITMVLVGTAMTYSIYALESSQPAWSLPVRLIQSLGPGALLILLYLFPDGRFVPRITFAPAIAWGLWTILWPFFPKTLLNPNRWPPTLFVIVFLGWLVTGVFAQIYRYVRVSTAVQKQQTKWIVFGTTASVLGFFLIIYMLTSALPPIPQSKLTVFFYQWIRTPAYTLVLILAPLSIGISILRYRLWDIDVIIHRSLVYGILTVFLGGLYFLLVRLLTIGAQAITRTSDSSLAVFTATLSIALAAAPLRRRVQTTIDRTFYRGKLDYQRLLSEMSAQLATNIVLEKLTPLLTQNLPQRLQISKANLWVLDPSGQALTLSGSEGGLSLDLDHPLVKYAHESGQPLTCSSTRVNPPQNGCRFLREQGMEVCLPLVVGSRLVGLYNLGEKLSGIPYTNQEIGTLQVLGQQVAISVENARLYREISAYSLTLEAQVRQRTHELEAAYEDLAEQHQTLHIILRSIADGLVVTDPDGWILMVNPAFANLLSRRLTDLPGKRLHDVLPSPALLEVINSAQAQSDIVSSADVVLPNGRVLRAAVGVLRGIEQRARGVVTVLRDITQEVEVAQMKDDFVSMVSHELRTPLTSVLGFAKLILRQFDRDILPRLKPRPNEPIQAANRIQENLAIIVNEGERLTRLINDVLDVARLEAGRIQWEMSQVDLTQVIQNSVEAILALAQEKGLRIETEISSSLPHLNGDRDRLVQVMTNLLANAVKFTDQGSITVRAWRLEPGENIAPYATRQSNITLNLPAPKPCVVVSVTDTGIGIDEADLSTVFEKFKQAGDRASGTRRQGTGLGLAICKEIVEHHQGQIWVESSPGKGSRFLFMLPLRLSQDESGSR
jgi:PAS domain S-box-containing protein